LSAERRRVLILKGAFNLKFWSTCKGNTVEEEGRSMEDDGKGDLADGEVEKA